MQAEVIVVGGGAAGMMAALFAAQAGAATIVLERNDRLGRKLAITGKGRCNVTNNCSVSDLVSNIPGNGRFLFSAFSFLDSPKTMRLFEELGVPLKVERGQRVFPVSDRADELVRCLQIALIKAGVKIHYGRRVNNLREEGEGFVLSGAGFSLTGRSVVIATGGLSYPRTGSSGDGYLLAKQVKHTIADLRPALVPLEIEEQWVRDASGLALKNVMLRAPGGADFGEMLFTHFGISGPLVLTMSSHIVPALSQGPVPVSIDLKPALTVEKLEARILRDFTAFSRKQFSNSLGQLLPSSLIQPLVALSGIHPHKPVNQVTRTERTQFVDLLKSVPLTVMRARPIEEAIVTAGGVRTPEINPQTMESKLIPRLYFCGEVIDVDGYTGGFNLQIAWSTGALAGSSAARNL